MSASAQSRLRSRAAGAVTPAGIRCGGTGSFEWTGGPPAATGAALRNRATTITRYPRIRRIGPYLPPPAGRFRQWLGADAGDLWADRSVRLRPLSCACERCTRSGAVSSDCCRLHSAAPLSRGLTLDITHPEAHGASRSRLAERQPSRGPVRRARRPLSSTSRHHRAF